VSVAENPARTAPVAGSPGRVAPRTRTASSWLPIRPQAVYWRRLRAALSARCHAAALDRDLAAGVMPRGSDALALRARRITGRRSRASVAYGLARVLRTASDTRARFTAAVPPHRREVLVARPVIDALGHRLHGAEPVTARGMAMLTELLSEPTSPLYRPDEPGALGSRLRAAAAALEPSNRWE